MENDKIMITSEFIFAAGAGIIVNTSFLVERAIYTVIYTV